MKIAIDAQILLRNHARRTVLATAELCEVAVMLPETVVTMAKIHYATVCENYVRRALEWADDVAGKHTSAEEMGLRVHDATQKLGIGFGRWIDEETLRNDGVFTKAPRTRRGQGVAMELSEAGVVDDPEDRRWGVGEDPYVIAEALEAGAHWLASDNFRTLNSDVMEIWLDKVQARGRYTQVPRPFILSSEEALREMLERSSEWREAEPETMRRAIVHAVSEPTDTGRAVSERVGIFQRFAKDLKKCGMMATGQEMDRWARKMRAAVKSGRTQEVEQELMTLASLVPTERVQRTRDAEERRMAAEQVVSPPRRPDISQEHEEWKAQALAEALEDGDLALFLWTWDEEDGDAVEAAERLGLMASRREDGELYMR